MDERAKAAAFGEWVRTRRGRLSRARVAQLASISISTLTTIEEGGRMVRGEWVLPSPAERTLIGLADALGEAPRDVFFAAGLPVPGHLLTVEPRRDEPQRRPAALSGKIEQLSDDDREYVESLVDRLLGERDA